MHPNVIYCDIGERIPNRGYRGRLDTKKETEISKKRVSQTKLPSDYNEKASEEEDKRTRMRMRMRTYICTLKLM